MLSFDQIEHGRQLQKEKLGKEYEVQSPELVRQMEEHKEKTEQLVKEFSRKDQALHAALDEKAVAAAFNVVEKMLTTALNHSRVLSGRAGRVRQPLWDLLLDMKMRHNLDFGAEEMDEARKAAGITMVDYTY